MVWAHYGRSLRRGSGAGAQAAGCYLMHGRDRDGISRVQLSYTTTRDVSQPEPGRANLPTGFIHPTLSARVGEAYKAPAT